MDIEFYYDSAKAIYEGKDLNGDPIKFSTKEKADAYSDLISKIETVRPDIVDCKELKVFTDFYLNDLFSNQFQSLMGYRHRVVDWPVYNL